MTSDVAIRYDMINTKLKIVVGSYSTVKRARAARDRLETQHGGTLPLAIMPVYA